jgi:hypothetical protein
MMTGQFKQRHTRRFNRLSAVVHIGGFSQQQRWVWRVPAFALPINGTGWRELVKAARFRFVPVATSRHVQFCQSGQQWGLVC